MAGAAKGRADVVVTNNLKDFPASNLPDDLDVQSADEFLLYAVDLQPDVVLAAAERVAAVAVHRLARALQDRVA